jgi:hypothetical protein
MGGFVLRGKRELNATMEDGTAMNEGIQEMLFGHALGGLPQLSYMLS